MYDSFITLHARSPHAFFLKRSLVPTLVFPFPSNFALLRLIEGYKLHHHRHTLDIFVNDRQQLMTVDAILTLEDFH